MCVINEKYLTLKEIQEEEKNILSIVVNYLEQNDINYSIYYGTLLGAIRHNGFIPWDDDIDLALLRKDYNILLKCLKRDKGIIDKKNGIEAIGFEIGNSICPYIKIVNKNIEIDDDFNYDHYLWIDMFPLDNIKDNYSLYFKKLDILRSIFFLKRDEINDVPSKTLKNKIGRFIVRFINFNKFLNKYINYCKKYENLDTKLIAKNAWARKTISLKEKFKVIDDYFDNVKISRIEDYDYHLKVLYGNNYMELPPVEKRVTHLFKARYVDKSRR